MVPVIKKPIKQTEVTKNTAKAIDRITNSLLNRTTNTGIIQLDVSNDFPIYLITLIEKIVTSERGGGGWGRGVQITKLT